MLLVAREKHMYAQILSEKTDMLYVRVYISQTPATNKGGGDVGGVMLVKNGAEREKEKKAFFFFHSPLAWEGEMRDVTYAALILLLLACGCPSFATNRIGLVNDCIT